MSARWADMRARGFGVVELVLVVAALGALIGVYTLVDSHGFNRGLAQAEAKASREKAEAVEAQLRKDRAVGQALIAADVARVAAELERQGYQAKWKEARREAQRVGSAMGSCESAGGPSQDVEAAGGGAPGNAAEGVRAADAGARHRAVYLWWRFVGLHDSAFLGVDGKPLFQDSAAYALDASRADTASPYTLDDAIDVHGDNAGALNACRKAYFNARRDLEVAAQAWNEASGR